MLARGDAAPITMRSKHHHIISDEDQSSLVYPTANLLYANLSFIPPLPTFFPPPALQHSVLNVLVTARDELDSLRHRDLPRTAQHRAVTHPYSHVQTIRIRVCIAALAAKRPVRLNHARFFSRRARTERSRALPSTAPSTSPMARDQPHAFK